VFLVLLSLSPNKVLVALRGSPRCPREVPVVLGEVPVVLGEVPVFIPKLAPVASTHVVHLSTDIGILHFLLHGQQPAGSSSTHTLAMQESTATPT
jgi:hypothetical protein